MIDSNQPNLMVKIPEAHEIKRGLKALLQFDAYCELGKESGEDFSHKQQDHAITKAAFISFLEKKGCPFDPETELLETAEKTFVLITMFFQSQKKMPLEGIDYEQVKAIVKKFMDLSGFVSVLKEKGWRAHKHGQAREYTSPTGEVYSEVDMSTKWKSLKIKVLESLCACGFGYDKSTDSFKQGKKVLTIDEVYDAIKKQVLEQLIKTAGEMGYSFDMEKSVFTKEGRETTVRDIIIQANFKIMRI